MLVMLYLTVGIYRMGRVKGESKTQETFSIIVAARNEERNILTLLKSLEEQSYPKELFEVIIANDRSSDNTASLITEYAKNSTLNIKLVTIKEGGTVTGKKAAVTKAIEKSTNNILLFTDADCVVGKSWIASFNKAYDKNTDYILAYTHVKFEGNRVADKLKTLEAILYRAIACAGLGNKTPITASASNMSYRKRVYLQSDGFDKYKSVRSGDDDLQLFNLWRNIDSARYLFSKESMVFTNEKPDLDAHINLKTRRASKFRYYPLPLKLFSFGMFIYFIFFISSVVITFINLYLTWLFLLLFVTKVISELIFLGYFCTKIDKLKYLKYYFLFTVIYVLEFFIFSIKGTVGKYKWKN